MEMGALVFLVLLVCTGISFMAIPSIHMRIMHLLYRRITGKRASKEMVQKSVFYSLTAFPFFVFAFHRAGFFSGKAGGHFQLNTLILSVPVLLLIYVAMSYGWYRVLRDEVHGVIQEIGFTVPGAVVALVPLFLSLGGIVLLIHVAFGPGALEEFSKKILSDFGI